MLETEPEALYMLGECLITELNPSPMPVFINNRPHISEAWLVPSPALLQQAQVESGLCLEMFRQGRDLFAI